MAPIVAEPQNNDVLIGEFTTSITIIGGEPLLSVWYSPTAQPVERRTQKGVVSLHLSGNKADYRILLAMRAPAEPPRRMV